MTKNNRKKWVIDIKFVESEKNSNLSNFTVNKAIRPKSLGSWERKKNVRKVYFSYLFGLEKHVRKEFYFSL